MVEGVLISPHRQTPVFRFKAMVLFYKPFKELSADEIVSCEATQKLGVIVSAMSFQSQRTLVSDLGEDGEYTVPIYGSRVGGGVIVVEGEIVVDMGTGDALT